MKISKRFVQVAIALIIACFCIAEMNTASGQQISGYQIKNEAIAYRHLDDSLRAVIAFMINDSTVSYANVAFDVVAGTLNWGNFTTTTRDSFEHGLIEYADTAGIVLSIADDAIDDTSKFTSDLRETIAGRKAAPWIYYTVNAQFADSSEKAGHASTADVATSALSAPTQDTCDYAYSAKVSDFAYAVLGSDTVLSADSANYADTSGFAEYADSLTNDAIESAIPFTAAMLDSYMTTKGQNDGLDETHGAGSSNRVLTKSDADSLYVETKTSSNPISINIGIAANLSSNVAVFDTVQNAIRFQDGSGDKVAVIDSAKIHGYIGDSTDAARDYADGIAAGLIARGDSGAIDAPKTISVKYNDPTAPSWGDMFVDVGDTTLKYWNGSAWLSVSSGGAGGGTADNVNMDRRGGAVDADNLLTRTSTDGVDVDTVNLSNMLFQNNITVDDTAFVNILNVDSIVGNNATKDSLHVKAALLPSGDAVYSLGGSNNRWNELRAATIYGTTGVFTGNVTLLSGYFQANSIIPTTTADSLGKRTAAHTTTGSYTAYLKALDIGSSATTYFTVSNSADLNITNGSATLAGTTDLTLSTPSNDISLNGGNITIDDGNLYMNETAGDPRIQFEGADAFITVNGGTTDSVFCMTEDQNEAIDAACPYPTLLNPVITRNYAYYNNIAYNMQYGTTRANRTADDFVTQRKSYYSYMVGLVSSSCVPTSNDSLWGHDLDLSPLWIPNTFAHYDPHIPIDPPNGDPTWVDDFVVGGQFGMHQDTSVSDTVTVYPTAVFDYPALHGEYVIGDQFNDTLGTITGYFKTLQCALDSLPYLRVVTSRVSNDTVYVLRSSGAKLYYGNTSHDTIGADENIPAQFLSPGAFFFRETNVAATGDSGRSWNMIDHWIDSSKFVISGNGATYVTDNASCLGRIAAPMLVTVTKPRTGGAFFLTDTVKIHMDHCPVHIRGLGEDVTVITNAVNGYKGATGTPIMFQCVSGGDNGYGLPLTFSGMTIITADSTSDDIQIQLGGRVVLKDMKIGGRAKNQKYILGYYNGTNLADNNTVRGMLSFTMDNVDMAPDTGITAIAVLDTLVNFSAKNCEFMYGGANGKVFYATDPGTGGRREFSQCTFYADAGSSATPFTIAGGDSIYARNCSFLGAATYETTTSGRIIGTLGTLFNYADAYPTIPPAGLDRSSWRYFVSSLPK